MNLRRGDIVLANLPYSDQTGSKVRPALVVQCDRNNDRLDDVILVMITSVIARATAEPTQLFVEISAPEGQSSGLLRDSAVKCEHLVTLDRSLIGRVIGQFPPGVMRKIDGCLRESLGLA